ncbi:MAG: septum formation initiator family protein [Lachnospiraceae bacterium]|nr:septum formation initiator family protein [Lachnospiraceae bacterium]
MARRRRRKKKENNRNLGLITVVLVIMLTIVGVHSNSLWARKADLETERAQLAEQIEAENARTEELKQLRKYVQTDSYAKEVAQDKLGLVHEGEIVFEIEK